MQMAVGAQAARRRSGRRGRPRENEAVTSGNGVLKILLSEGFPENSDGPKSVQMLSTAEIATGCFFMRFVATLPLVTASFSLGHTGKGNWVCAMLVEHGCGIIAVESPEGWHW